MIVASNTSFALSDIQNDLHKSAIIYLQEKGIINGYPDGTFRPNQELNRAEFMKLVIAHKVGQPDPNKYKNCFPDVKEEWFAPYICYAKAQGWVKGYPDNYFRPANKINKVETIKIILEINDYQTVPTQLPYTDLDPKAWYYGYLQIAYENYLLEETGSKYSPAAYMKRGAVSEILYRILVGEASYEPPAVLPPPEDDEDDDTISISQDCEPSNEVIGTTVNVSNVTELSAAIQLAKENGNTTILLADGTYTIPSAYWIDNSNIVIRSQSGNREKVVVKGAGMSSDVTHVFQLAGDNITVADMTLGWVANHAIQVHGEKDADEILMHNLEVVDAYQQLIKVSYDSQDQVNRSDNGILECSTLKYSAGIGPQYYIGGIDAHFAKDWIVRDNLFMDITSPEADLAEYAIHFWSNAENTLVENNTILNSDRGIGFGMGDRGHIGGIIRNNKIYHNNSKGDVGIALENARDALVEGNIILFENDYPNAIEYRFAGSYGITIKNNFINKIVKSRDGGEATLENNSTVGVKDFVNPPAGDFTKI